MLTLKKVKELVEAPVHTKRVPSPKVLLEEGLILKRKEFDHLELSRRGGKVNIGKYGSTEVDFVTQKEGVLTYYQVTADMTAEETFEREMRPLRSIQDNYEKIVLTLDRFSLGNYDGIKVVNVIDWLLG